MKTKLFFIASLCALALVACNSPKDPADKNEIVKDALSIDKKHYSEAVAYLESKDYAAWRYEEPMEGEYGRFIFCKPKEMAQSSNFMGALETDVYECIQLFYDVDGIVNQVHAIQQFSSNKSGWDTYRSWLTYMDKLITPTTTFYGTIATTSLKKENGEYVPTTESTVYFDGFENSRVEQNKEQTQKAGHNIGNRQDFDRDLETLDLSLWARTTVLEQLLMWDEQDITDTYQASFKSYTDKAKAALETDKTPLPRAEFSINAFTPF